VTVAEQPQEQTERRGRHLDPELQLGGADAVEKTTYVVGKGTDPNARKGEGASATVPGRGAPVIVLAIVGVLVLLVAIAYFIGIFG
jgi:hypothetical protein